MIFLENRISEIIQYRHGIVHHFAIDRSLTKEAYTHILDAILLAVEEFVRYIEVKYNFEIDKFWGIFYMFNAPVPFGSLKHGTIYRYSGMIASGR